MHIIYLIGYLVWAAGFIWTQIYTDKFDEFRGNDKNEIPRHQLESWNLEKGGTVLISEVLFCIGMMMAFIRLLQVTRK